MTHLADWLAWLFFAHLICFLVATFDLNRCILRTRARDDQSYISSGFMAGAVAVLLVPVLGELMWFFLRRQINDS